MEYVWKVSSKVGYISLCFESALCALHVWSIGGYKVFSRCPPCSKKVRDSWKMIFSWWRVIWGLQLTILGYSNQLKVSFFSVFKISNEFSTEQVKGGRLGPSCVEGQVSPQGQRVCDRGLAGHSRGAGTACHPHRKDAGGWGDGKGINK